MNLWPSWATFLAEAGFEAIHWPDVGAGDASDDELLRWAAEHEHVVLTSDLDFGAILAASQRRRPSVIQIRSELLTPDAIGSTLLGAIEAARQEQRVRALGFCPCVARKVHSLLR